ncbi:MAG: hypothetical protein E7586_06365 [Ruminococcaceae bacterium]|nr:hypothetical protein [Oscillospiraceae bacterium]
MSDLKLSFEITKIPFNAISLKNQQKTVEIQGNNECVKCSFWYDFHPEPLALNGFAQVGDSVDVVLMKHRIELYVNGSLVDEEWPNGNRLFAWGDNIKSDSPIKIEPYFPLKQEQPSVSSVFFNAEGWKPEENVFVGDCMPYVNGDEYHVLYLKDRHHHYSKWGMGAHQWSHISTRDFAEWRVHPMAVEITDPTEGSICTGSWIKHNDKEYLYYTVRRGGNLPAPVCRSVSHDGYHFEKDMDFGFVLPDIYNKSVARDPKIIKGGDGLFHMILTTALVFENKGCLAHFVSDDLENWRDTNLPIYISEDSTEPECPDYIVYNGRYYLIFSLKGKARYMLSDSPFDGWKVPKNPNIPCASVPKGAVWNDKIVFAGFKGIDGYAGTMTFKTANSDDNGELVFS